MKEALIKKMEKLGAEAMSLAEKRDIMTNMIQEIDVRLHQISGALTEIDQLLKDGEDSEISKNDNP
jgi:hypothetical protein